MQLAEIDGVHQIPCGNLLNGVEDIRPGIGRGLVGIKIAGQIGQCVVLHFVEVRHGSEVAAEIAPIKVIRVHEAAL